MPPLPKTLAFLAAAALLGSAPIARAADLDENYGYAEGPQDIPAVQLPQTKVEFGTGWYVRGDIGVTRLPSLDVATPTLPTSASFLPPPAPNLSFRDGSKAGYVASLGAGYSFNKWFRGDVIFDFHEPITTTSQSGNGAVFCPTGVSYPNMVTNPDGSITYGNPSYANGGCTGNYRAHLDSYDVLVNGYVDLGTWYRVTPYVGAGIGLSFGHYQQSSTYIQANNSPYMASFADPKFMTTFTFNYDRSGSGTYYNFAYALMAGVAIDIYDHTKLDVGYRYLNVGSVPTLGGKLSFNEFRVGLRYMIDN